MGIGGWFWRGGGECGTWLSVLGGVCAGVCAGVLEGVQSSIGRVSRVMVGCGDGSVGSESNCARIHV